MNQSVPAARMHWHDFTVSFLSILFEGIPFMFVGTLISGMIDAFVPADAIERRMPRNAAASIALSSLLGAVLPMCECGVIPIIRRMLQKGLPISSAVAYLLAAPIINIVVAISTYAAFRGQEPELMTGLRLSMAFLVSFLVACVVHRLPAASVLNRKLLAHKPAPPEHHAHKPIGHKIIGAIRCSAMDFLDVGMYLVIGAAITSFFNSAISRETLLPLTANAPLAICSMMLLAMLLSLCSTSDAFIAANFVAFPLSAKLGFLVLGPMMDLKLLFMYQMVFRKTFTLRLAIALFLLIGADCLALHSFLP